MGITEIYALNNIKGVGPKAIIAIMKHLESNSIDTIKDINLDNLLKDKRLSRYNKVLQAEIPWDIFEVHIEKAKKEIYDIEKKGIHIISMLDESYPILLKMTDNAPMFLYCKGNISLLKTTNNIAVVGTRNNTEHGKIITTKSVKFMCEHGYTIVSGLALGIDSIAHQTTLNAGGKTISVLVDVDNIQPSSNRKLADDILNNNGLLIAEMPPGIKIIPPMFAKRDRIQSGLSLAVFPIETNIAGGTMHAVKAALKENRLVYVPDVNTSGYSNTGIPQLRGIKYLLKENKAIPYTKTIYEDILRSLELKNSALLSPVPTEGRLL